MSAEQISPEGEKTMAKQMLIYESVVPVNAQRHGDVSIQATRDYGFSASVNAVPLMAVEFIAAAAEYAIVFTEVGDDVVPAAVLGMRGTDNVYVASDSHWSARYIPAFIRRYPFVFASTPDNRGLAVCIDESCPGVNREGRGERLFTHDGKPTAYVKQVMQFLREYQAQFERTRAFGKKVRELGLLEPVQAAVTSPRGNRITMSGMQTVSRKKLRELGADAALQLLRSDELELLYLQMFSLRNFSTVKERLIDRLKEHAGPAEKEAAVAAP
jgi:hypothetical protein